MTEQVKPILDHPFEPSTKIGEAYCLYLGCGRPLAEHRHEFKDPLSTPRSFCAICKELRDDPRHSKPESAMTSKPSLPNRAVEFLRIASKSAFTQAESEMFTEIADYLSQQQSAESDNEARIQAAAMELRSASEYADENGTGCYSLRNQDAESILRRHFPSPSAKGESR